MHHGTRRLLAATWAFALLPGCPSDRPLNVRWVADGCHGCGEERFDKATGCGLPDGTRACVRGPGQDFTETVVDGGTLGN